MIPFKALDFRKEAKQMQEMKLSKEKDHHSEVKQWKLLLKLIRTTFPQYPGNSRCMCFHLGYRKNKE